MARRRMIGTSVIGSDAYLDLEDASKALYPFIVLNADDNGLLNNMKALVRTFNVQDTALVQLIKAGFILALESGVFAVTHWEQQNHVPKSKFTATMFPDELEKLEIMSDGRYRVKEQ